MKIKSLKSNNGFTIVELMIALSVLSVILIMSTVILIQIGNLYTKGINAALLQNTTRNTLTDLSSAIEYSGTAPHAPIDICVPATCCTPLTCYAKCIGGAAACLAGNGRYSYCIGTSRYSYILNREMGTDNSKAVGDPMRDTPHVLWRDTMTSSQGCDPLDITVPGTPSDGATDLTNPGTDVIPDKMRLTRFRAEELPVGSRSYNIDMWLAFGDDDLVNTDLTGGVDAGRSNCNGGNGSQFCGVSELSNSVTRRIE